MSLNDFLTATKPRRLYLDVLRGLAVVWMIETHVFNLIDSSWKSGWFYHFLYMSNGYVAVAFAFCAGAGFQLASAARERCRSAGGGEAYWWKHLRRQGFLIVVAYWLNMAPFSWRHLRSAEGADLQGIFQSDILLVIGFSSLVALLIHVAVRRTAIENWIFLALALTVFLITPLVWSSGLATRLPVFLAMPLSPIPPSKFPFFPWIGYFFAGAAAAGLLERSRRPRMMAAITVVVALAAPFIAFYVKEMNFTYPGMSGPYAEWYPSPGHSFFRVAGVLFVFAVFFLADEKLKYGRAVTRFLERNGQESLFMYLSHVFVIFGSSFTLGLSQIAAGRLGPWEALLDTALITAVCYAAACAWRAYKKTAPRAASATLTLTVLLTIILFFLMPLPLENPKEEGLSRLLWMLKGSGMPEKGSGIP